HHRTSIFLAGPLSLALFVTAFRSAGPKRIASLALAAMGAMLLPLASYGVIAWRAFHPARVQWPVLGPSWGSVLDHVSARHFLGYVGRYAPEPAVRPLLGWAAY